MISCAVVLISTLVIDSLQFTGPQLVNLSSLMPMVTSLAVRTLSINPDPDLCQWLSIDSNPQGGTLLPKLVDLEYHVTAPVRKHLKDSFHAHSEMLASAIISRCKVDGPTSKGVGISGLRQVHLVLREPFGLVGFPKSLTDMRLLSVREGVSVLLQ